MRHPPREPHEGEQLLGAGAGPALLHLPDQEGHHHVLQGGEFPQEMMELKDKAQLAVPQLGEGGRVQVGVARAVEPDVSARGPIQRAEQVQQGALPGSRRAHDGDELAAVDLELHGAQHLERLAVAAGEYLADPPGFEQRRHS